MDALTKSVLAAASRVDLPTMTVNRHLAVLRTVMAPDDEAHLIRACLRADRKWQGDLLLTVTSKRLVLTRARLLRGVRLYLAADRAELGDVRWAPHGSLPYLELSFQHHDTGYVLWFAGFQPAELTAVDADLARAFG